MNVMADDAHIGKLFSAVFDGCLKLDLELFDVISSSHHA